MNRNTCDILQNEIRPSEYFRMLRERRARSREEWIAGIFIGIFGLVLFAMVEIAFGIWR